MSVPTAIFRLAERHPALAHAVMAPLICWSFSNAMFRYRLVDHAVPAMWRSKRSWAGEVRNVSLLVAIGVNESGYRESRAAELVETAVEETLTYYAFPEEQDSRNLRGGECAAGSRAGYARAGCWCESAASVVGAFPDGQSALDLAAARLRHIAGTAWSSKRYLNIELLKDQQMRGAMTDGASDGCRSAQTKVRKILDSTRVSWPLEIRCAR